MIFINSAPLSARHPENIAALNAYHPSAYPENVPPEGFGQIWADMRQLYGVVPRNILAGVEEVTPDYDWEQSHPCLAGSHTCVCRYNNTFRNVVAVWTFEV